jgi:hypothetical protein
MDTGGSVDKGLPCKEGKKQSLIRADRGPTAKITERNEIKNRFDMQGRRRSSPYQDPQVKITENK